MEGEGHSKGTHSAPSGTPSEGSTGHRPAGGYGYATGWQMSQYLYVCLFSNGHIKVGRSYNPKARIADHVERVACVGISLDDSRTYECAGNVAAAESELIKTCSETASEVHKNEWFVGLSFQAVCEIAEAHASIQYPATGDHPLAKAIDVVGSSAELARRLGVTRAAVHQWGLPGRRVPAEHCPTIEKITDGALMCEDIRPDVEWAVLVARGAK